MTNTDTTIQLIRVTTDWTKIAGEPVKVEMIGGAFYGFCSELGALRLFHKYQIVDGRAKAAYSDNLQTWFFRLEQRT